ncbi:MAG: hypothetical protein LBT71_03545, partial [Azoarcus sp.]|nr:hypothetical protein [Azoarcus sp.]
EYATRLKEVNTERVKALDALIKVQHEEHERISNKLDALATRESGIAAAEVRNTEEMYAQAGGFNGRLIGEGPKYRAARALADKNADTLGKLATTGETLRANLATVNDKITDLENERSSRAEQFAAAQKNIDTEMANDHRYQPPREASIISDASLLWGIVESGREPGLLAIAAMAFSMLFALEGAFFISCVNRRFTPYDIALREQERLEAAEVVTRAELAIARVCSQVPIWVEPAPQTEALQ